MSFYFDTLEGKKVKQIELSMLEEVIRICEKHNLRYFADSGTLLGAVRHNGFIPWDDDIDLVMLRPDYNKLIKLAKEFKSPFFLQSTYTDKKYTRGHIQIRYDGTAMILPSEGVNVKFHQGIFLDIFPLDVYPKDFSQFSLFIEKINKIKRFIDLSVINKKNYGGTHKILFPIFQKIFPLKLYYKYFEKECSKFWELQDGYFDKIYWREQNSRFLKLEKSWYKDNIELPFEELKISCPKEFDKILKEMFGNNYMIPVQENSAHGKVIINPNISYLDILPTLKE